MEIGGRKLNLSLPINSFNTTRFDNIQKCYLPNDLFPKDVLAGSYAKCVTSAFECYLCRIYPVEYEIGLDHCILDRSVRVSENIRQVEKYDEENCLKQVEFVPKGGVFHSIAIEVELRSFSSKISSRQFLGKVCANLLRPYLLTAGCVVVCDEMKHNFGISKIYVESSDPPLVLGQVNRSTVVSVNRVQYVERRFLKCKIAGMDRIKKQLDDIKEDLKLRGNTQRSINPSCNTLIIGPSGCGKTSLLHEFAATNHCNLFTLKASDMVGSYPGETEQQIGEFVRNVKMFVKILKPEGMTMILVENVEEICTNITNFRDSSHALRVSLQFKALLDELHEESSEIVVFGTTTSIESIDLAVRRAGRFEHEIYINVPDQEQRIEILKMFFFEYWPNLAQEESLQDVIVSIAKQTKGFVGSDLVLLTSKVEQDARLKNHGEITSELLREFFEHHLPSVMPSSVRDADISVVHSDIDLSCIGGMQELKDMLNVSILVPFRRPDAFQRFGLRPPKGILLYGPPGCAKTTVVKCLAKEANMTLITASGAEVYSPYVGCSEKYIQKIFNKARLNMPCLIFFDEIDALVGTRASDTRNEVQTRVLSTLLMEMDGVGVKLHSANFSDSMTNIIMVVGATNRPDIIDDALLRPGRFDRLIYVPAPERLSRYEILQLCKKKIPFSDEIDFQYVAQITKGFSGADLVNLCNEAALQAMSRDMDTDEVSSKDFETVLLKTRPSLTPDQIDVYEKFAAQSNV